MRQQKARLEGELQVLQSQYRQHEDEALRRFTLWTARMQEALRGCDATVMKRFSSAVHASRLDTRVRRCLALLEALQAVEPAHKSVLLVKAGQPLTGRAHLQEILAQAQTYVKIQEPYPSTDLLLLIESLAPSVRCTLLIGPVEKKSAQFREQLDLLRKAGRSIVVKTIANKEGKAPFHDRFVMTERKCFAIGSSVSGLGLRDSAIIEVPNRAEIEKQFDLYMNSPTYEHKGASCTLETL